MPRKYYVTMTDKFFSGWGLCAGRINKMVVECDTYGEAAQIERAARQRSEMQRVSIRSTKPYYGAHVMTTWKTYGELSGPWKEA